MCIIVEEEGDVAAFKDYVPQPGDDQPPPGKASAPPPPPPAAAAPPPVAAATSAPPPPRPAAPIAPPAGGQGARIFATPLAKTLAAEKGVDLRVRHSCFFLCKIRLENKDVIVKHYLFFLDLCEMVVFFSWARFSL